MFIKDFLQIDPKAISGKITEFIKEKVEAFDREGVIMGLSGGIDSSCVAVLAVKALGPDRVFGLLMPERDSSKESVEYAHILAHELGIKTQLIDHTPILEKWGIYDLLSNQEWEMGKAAFTFRRGPEAQNVFMRGQLGIKPKRLRKLFAYINIKHRVRSITHYYYAEQMNYLVAGTTNKSTNLTGLTVKYGGVADIMPLKNLYKTQIKVLSEFIGVPRPILERPPSPDLFPGFTDLSVLGMEFDQLDIILVGLERGVHRKLIAEEAGITEDDVKRISKLIMLTEHKRNLPGAPVLY